MIRIDQVIEERTLLHILCRYLPDGVGEPRAFIIDMDESDAAWGCDAGGGPRLISVE